LSDPLWRLNELSTGDMDLDMQASIERVYRCLEERERRAFRLLSLLGAAGTSGRMTSALLGLGLRGAELVLGKLEEAHLLEIEAADDEGAQSYRFSELICACAQTLLKQEEMPSEIQEALERVSFGAAPQHATRLLVS